MSATAPEKSESTSKNATEGLIKWVERLIGASLMGSLIFTGIVCIIMFMGMRALGQEAHDAGAEEAKQVAAAQILDRAEAARLAAALEVHRIETAAKFNQQQKQLDLVTNQMFEMKLVNIETSMNVKQLVENKGLKPINLSESRDNGRDGGR